MTDDLDLVTLATYPFVAEAQTAKVILEGQGIVAVLADSELVQTNWMLGSAVGYVKLQVPRQSVEHAARIVEELSRKRQQRALTPERPDQDVCLECGATLPEDATVCSKCGWTFLSAVEGQPSPDEEPNEL